MAKQTTSGPGPAKRSSGRKVKPAGPADGGGAKPKKPGRSASVRSVAANTRRATSKGLDRLADLIEHPLVADLIAVGAMAAVAAIADQMGGKKRPPTKHSVKAAARAAGAAMGARLLSEFSPANRPGKGRDEAAGKGKA